MTAKTTDWTEEEREAFVWFGHAYAGDDPVVIDGEKHGVVIARSLRAAKAEIAEFKRLIHGHDCPQAVIVRAEADSLRKELVASKEARIQSAAAFDVLDKLADRITKERDELKAALKSADDYTAMMEGGS